MTVSTTENRKSYIGDGISTVFAFPYLFLQNSDLHVYIDGLEIGSGFTVTGAGADAGGNVTFNVAPIASSVVLIVRQVDLLQTTDLPSNGPFPAGSVERIGDKAMLGLQYLFDYFQNSLGVSDGQLALNLLNNVDYQKGAALVAFNNALAYPNGSIGYALEHGASMSGYQRTATGSVGRTVQSVLEQDGEVSAFDFLTPAQISDVQARTQGYDLTTQLQAFLNACRGKRGLIPAGTYRCDGKLTYDPLYPTIIRGEGYISDSPSGSYLQFTNPAVNGLEVVYSYAQWAPGGGADSHTAYDVAHGGGALGNSDNLVRFESFSILGPGALTAAGTQSIQLFGAGSETQATGCGIFAYWANAAVFKDLWVSGWPNTGLRMLWCFGSRIEGGYYNANRAAGIVANNVNNLLTLDGVKCIGNGIVSGAYASYNCLIGTEGASASSFPSRGIEISGKCDFEGAGSNAAAGYAFMASTGTITAVSVAGGIATATLTGTINFASGHWVGVNGGTSTAGNSALNTAAPAVLLSKTATQITWATLAPNGSYGITGLAIRPYVVGLGLKGVYAGAVNAYTEGCAGPSVYVYQDCCGLELSASSYNDAKVYVDGFWSGTLPTVVGAGSGYALNDVLTLSGGTIQQGQVAATVTVTGVSAGNITALAFVDAGHYFVPPGASSLDPSVSTSTGTITLSGGTGAGATMSCDWSANGPGGVVITGNNFTGANGGIYAQTEIGLQLAGNQYLPSGAERPSLYLGWLVNKLAQTLRETDTTIEQGMPRISRGINQFSGTSTPGHWSNAFSGIGAGLALQDSGSGAARQNNAFGTLALGALQSGYSNNAIGFFALGKLTAGYFNTAIGNRVGQDATNLQNSCLVGGNAGRGIISGGNVVAVGLAAGQLDTPQADTGDSVYVGGTAGRRSGAVAAFAQVVIVGAQSTSWAGGSIQNYIGLGFDTQQFAASNRAQIGNASITSARVQVAWTIVSDAREKHEVQSLPASLGLAFVNTLRPVSYKRNGGDGTTELGLIAQEVRDVLPIPLGMVAYDQPSDRYGMRKDDLIAPLIKAVQELSDRVAALEARL